MGRPAKVTKHILLIALSRSLTVAQTARYLGVNRHSIYDAAKRFGVDLPTHLRRFPTSLPAPEVPEQLAPPVVQPALPTSPASPSCDPRRFVLADYTGPYRGDRSRPRTTPLLDRYERLKCK